MPIPRAFIDEVIARSDIVELIDSYVKLRKAGKNYSELTIIPEIGVIQEKTGFNQTDAENNVLELVSINGTPIESYLSNYCRAQTNSSAGRFFSNRTGSLKNEIGNGTVTNTNGNNNNNNPNTNNGTLPNTTVTTLPNDNGNPSTTQSKR